MAGVPMMVAYRVHPLTGIVVRRIAKVRYAALVNLLAAGTGLDAGPALVPEFMQQDCTPDTLARTLRSLLDDPAAVATQRAGFQTLLEGLRPSGGLLPSEAAAEAVIEVMEQA